MLLNPSAHDRSYPDDVSREIMRDPLMLNTPDEQIVATVLEIFLGGLEIVEG